MARKPTEIIALSLRVREELRRRLEGEAKKQRRSLNAEIVHRLEQSLQKEDEAAHMSRIASMAAETLSAAVEEKLIAKWVELRASALQQASQEPQQPPTLAPERPEHRKEGN